jgi:hypothetical protein
MNYKDTKNTSKLTIREKETINRFNVYSECSIILIDFFGMGFRSFGALKAIVLHHYPEIDLVKLKRLWNCQLMDDEIFNNVIYVFQKLKSE